VHSVWRDNNSIILYRPVASLLITGGGSFFSDFAPFSGFENWSSQWLSRGNPDFYRASAHCRDIDIAILSVRPPVGDVPVLDKNGLTYCHSFFTNTIAKSI